MFLKDITNIIKRRLKHVIIGRCDWDYDTTSPKQLRKYIIPDLGEITYLMFPHTQGWRIDQV